MHSELVMVVDLFCTGVTEGMFQNGSLREKRRPEEVVIAVTKTDVE